MANELAFFDRARAALEKSIDLGELKSIRDKAEALRRYAGSAQEMGKLCSQVKLRAERRLGELLAGNVRRGNPQLFPKGTIEGIRLRDLGITRKQSASWQLTATLPLADFERYLSTAREPSTAGIIRLVQVRDRETAGGPARGGHILTGPASRLWDKLADDSVDLFLTDPPYSEVDRYRELAELAAAKLKPGGLCLAYCGQWYLPAVLSAMGEHLEYHWTFAIRFGGPHRAVYPKRVANTWHPAVAFAKGKSTAGWIMDLLTSGGREKESHDHQKTLTDVEYFVEKLTEPGALVVDPYCGSGTVPAACRRLGRQWLACEVDSQTARTARRRAA
jgi:hypothetical protein